MLICFLAGFLVNSATGAAYCTTLANTEPNRRINPCVGTVTYSYYVPNGVGEGYLAGLARDKLNATLLTNLSPTCQQSIVSYTCSQIYKKCIGGLSNYIYLNDTGVSTRYLPFMRPCVSVCTDLSTSCSADALFKLTTLYTANCYSTTNYGYGYVYTFDLQNSASNCYTPSSTDSFASAVETYIQGEDKPCNGLVDTFVSIPGPKINSSYTTLLRPYVAQTIINEGLSTAFAGLPAYMDEECRLALKQYFCYQYFLKPDYLTFQAALTYSLSVNTNTFINAIKANVPTLLSVKFGSSILGAYVALPSYPHQDFCTSYTDKCSAFRARANKTALEPDCSKVTNDVASFPSANQTILTKIIPFSGNGLALHFQSQPDTQGYVGSNYSFTTTCPPYYAVNVNPDSDNVRSVSGTGCAVACKSGFWTSAEWDYFRDTGVAMTIVSIVLAVFTMTFIAILKDWKDSYLMFIYAMLSIVSSSGHLSLNSAKTFNVRYCEDPVTPHRLDNPYSPCVGTAVVSTYLYMVLCIIMFFMAVQRMLYVRKQEHVLSTPWYLTIQALLILLPPLGPMIGAIVREKYGYNGVVPWCSMDLVIGSYVMGFPTVVISFFTYILWLVASAIVMMGQHYVVVSQWEEKASAVELTTIDEKENAVPAEPASAEVAVVETATNQTLGAEEGGLTPPEARHIQSPVVTAEKKEETECFADNKHFRQLKYETVLGSVIFCSFALYFGFILLKFNDYNYSDGWRDSFITWTRCVFSNWDGSSSAFEATCGTHVHSRPTVPSVNLFQLIQFAPMIVIGPPFLFSYVYAYFHARHLAGIHSKRDLIPSTV